MSVAHIDQPPQTIICRTQKLTATKNKKSYRKSIRFVINYRLARIIKQEHVCIAKFLNELVWYCCVSLCSNYEC